MDKPDGLIELDFRIRRTALVLLYLVIFCLLALMLYYAQPMISFALTVLSPFIVSLIIAYMFNPLVTWLQERFGHGRMLAVVITYSLILLLTAGFFALLVPILYTQLRDGINSIVVNFPRVLEKGTEWLRLRVSPAEMEQAKRFMREHVDLDELTGRAGTALNQAVDTTRLITRIIGTTISIIIGFFAFVTFVVVIVFYFLLDYGRMEHVARVLLPDDKEGRVFGIWSKIDVALGGYLRGQMIVVTTIAVLYSIALFAMGMQQYAILIGCLAGFGNLIPYLGPVIAGVPAGLWVLFGDTYDGTNEKLIGIGLIVLLSVAVQSLDGFFLQPRVVGKNANVHPLLVLLALLVGAQFGIGGMIIAVPVAIMVRVVVKELWWDPLEEIERESKRMAAKKQVRYQVPHGTIADESDAATITPESKRTAVVEGESIASESAESGEAGGETAQRPRRRRRRGK